MQRQKKCKACGNIYKRKKSWAGIPEMPTLCPVCRWPWKMNKEPRNKQPREPVLNIKEG